ncbi:MAG TPA: DUF72 domain-containing protein [Sphingomicrobium sp.]|nr:DUF72 domain-containing protein [Sphingomicrobium sp.]
MARFHIGTAGWSIPRQYADQFPAEGTSLERYSARFPVAEINSSFHRPHRPATWERWRDSVPDDFRFSVKLPKQITHVRKLVDCSDELDGFLNQVALLGEKLAVLLVQLPPKLAFDEEVADGFFASLTARSNAKIACEPRHPSWFDPAADVLLGRLRIARVAADPAICPEAAVAGGWSKLTYWRLHGSPRMYRSSYQDRIAAYAEKLEHAARSGSDVWCIFDNTASSAALGDALALMKAVA